MAGRVRVVPYFLVSSAALVKRWQNARLTLGHVGRTRRAGGGTEILWAAAGLVSRVVGTRGIQIGHFCDVTSRGALPCSSASQPSAELLAVHSPPHEVCTASRWAHAAKALEQGSAPQM
eukprot:2797252-Prymnesium_polylepis.1